MGTRSLKPKKNETRPDFINRSKDDPAAAKNWRLKNGFRFELGNELNAETLFPIGLSGCEDDDDDNGKINAFITSEIDMFFDGDELVRRMRNNPDVPIDMEINTRGGSVDIAMGIFNAMAEHNGDVTVRITGMAASSGLLVAQAADRVLINENAKVMMHPGSIVGLFTVQGLSSNAQDDLDFMQEWADKGTEQIIDLLSIRSGQERSKVEGMVMAKGGNGTTLDAKEAVELGFADEVIAMVPRGEKQEPAMRNAAMSVWKERELANARKRQLANNS